jgi:hypothetical protein
MKSCLAPPPPRPARRGNFPPQNHLARKTETAALLKEIAALPSLLGSDHRIRRRRRNSPTWRQTQPKRSAAPLLASGITPIHGTQPGKLLELQDLQPAPSHRCLRTASPAGEAPVRLGGGEAVTRGKGSRETERGGEKSVLLKMSLLILRKRAWI